MRFSVFSCTYILPGLISTATQPLQFYTLSNAYPTVHITSPSEYHIKDLDNTNGKEKYALIDYSKICLWYET
jgi:hypothetical protein